MTTEFLGTHQQKGWNRVVYHQWRIEGKRARGRQWISNVDALWKWARLYDDGNIDFVLFCKERRKRRNRGAW